MEKMDYFFIILIFSIFVIGCTQNAATDSMEKGSISNNKDSSVQERYTGNVLAGAVSKYLEFNKVDYEKALNEKREVLLYFYADWCQICKAEQPQTIKAFNELNNPDLIGFRINYNDKNTDADEIELAKQFGITYQHTKIILKDKKQVLKALDSWDKQRYLDEISKIE